MEGGPIERQGGDGGRREVQGDGDGGQGSVSLQGGVCWNMYSVDIMHTLAPNAQALSRRQPPL